MAPKATLFCVMFLGLASGALCQGTWEGLRAVPPGDSIEIHTRSGEIKRTRLIGVSETLLTVSEARGTAAIDRREVVRVYRKVPRSGKRATLIGLGIGAGAGFLLGGAVSAARDVGEPGEHWLAALVGAGIGTGVGALTGYTFGGRQRKVLIYAVN